MKNQKIKTRPKRDKPNKKWTDNDIKKILNYLQEAPLIEAPTAQIFYKKLIERSNIDATWDLIRWKVRHLKASFKKANDWKKSTGAGDSDSGISTIEGRVLQICPHYKQLNEIFGKKNINGDFVVSDSTDLTTIEDSINVEETESMLETASLFEDKHDDEEMISILPAGNFFEIEGVPNSTPMKLTGSFKPIISSTVTKETCDFPETINKHNRKSSTAHLSTFQADNTEIFKLRLEWEKEKYNKELSLSDRKLKLEEEKVKNEMKFKILQLEKEEKLKILEYEMIERVKRYEIEIKYKYQSQK